MASDDILRESAILWIEDNTTFDTKQNPLPPNVELFIEKYKEVMGLRPGITSESISGLSQSFRSSDVQELLMQYAKSLLGNEFVPSDLRFVPAADRWV